MIVDQPQEKDNDMAHNIESIAWTNEVPWHGLGTKVADNLTTTQMLKAAKLDWTVSKQPLVTEAGVKVPGFFGLMRDSDDSVLDVTGPDYTPVQNVDAFKFFDTFLKAGNAKLDTAGSLNDGKMVWGLASLGKSFTLAGKDRVDSYLLAVIPHQQGKTLKYMSTNIRVVCNNTLTMALKAGSSNVFKHIHRKDFTEATVEEARKVITNTHEQFAEFHAHAETLSKKKFTSAASVEYLAGVFEPNDKLADVMRKPSRPLQLAIAALEHAPGANIASAKGTAWGALNAVTYTVDHLMGRKVDRRLARAWLGKTAELKRQALELAINA